MEPKAKKTAKPVEEKPATRVEKKAPVTPVISDTKALKKSIPAKVAKTARGLRTVKVAPKDKKAEALTPTEPTRKVTPVKVSEPAKPVKPAKVVKASAAVNAAKMEVAAKPARLDLSKLQRLSAGQRTYIRRLKQLARQEGTAYHAPFIQRASAK